MFGLYHHLIEMSDADVVLYHKRVNPTSLCTFFFLQSLAQDYHRHYTLRFPWIHPIFNSLSLMNGSVTQTQVPSISTREYYTFRSLLVLNNPKYLNSHTVQPRWQLFEVSHTLWLLREPPFCGLLFIGYMSWPTRWLRSLRLRKPLQTEGDQQTEVLRKFRRLSFETIDYSDRFRLTTCTLCLTIPVKSKNAPIFSKNYRTNIIQRFQFDNIFINTWEKDY